MFSKEVSIKQQNKHHHYDDENDDLDVYREDIIIMLMINENDIEQIVAAVQLRFVGVCGKDSKLLY